jgi:hypothetical protein
MVAQTDKEAKVAVQEGSGKTATTTDERSQPWKKFTGEAGKSDDDFITVSGRKAEGADETTDKAVPAEELPEVKADIWTV